MLLEKGIKAAEGDYDILVIGIGNENRGDDGIGPLIARELKKLDLPGASVECHSGEGTSLLACWEKAHIVVLLDAVNSDGSPGKIYRFEIPGQPLPTRFFRNFSTHQFGIYEALALGKALNRLPARLLIYGIEGRCFEQGAGLSPEVEKAAGEVVEMVSHNEFGIPQPGS
jgi:hydrogenase maturation protease